MCNAKVNEHAMMAYISQFRHLKDFAATEASQVSAWGPGLTEAVVNTTVRTDIFHI